MAMSDDLKAIEAQVTEGLAAAESMEALEALRVSVLGKKGSLTQIMRSMGKVSPEEHRALNAELMELESRRRALRGDE